MQALNCCIDTLQAFSADSMQCTIRAHATNNDANYIAEWFSKMSTLAAYFEDRIFKLLLHLVKFEKDELHMKKQNAINIIQREVLRLKLSTGFH